MCVSVGGGGSIQPRKLPLARAKGLKPFNLKVDKVKFLGRSLARSQWVFVQTYRISKSLTAGQTSKKAKGQLRLLKTTKWNLKTILISTGSQHSDFFQADYFESIECNQVWCTVVDKTFVVSDPDLGSTAAEAVGLLKGANAFVDSIDEMCQKLAMPVSVSTHLCLRTRGNGPQRCGCPPVQ